MTRYTSKKSKQRWKKDIFGRLGRRFSTTSWRLHAVALRVFRCCQYQLFAREKTDEALSGEQFLFWSNQKADICLGRCFESSFLQRCWRELKRGLAALKGGNKRPQAH